MLSLIMVRPPSSPEADLKNSGAPRRWQITGICLALAAITFAVFGQTLTHDFVNFDDDDYVYANPVVSQGLTWTGLKRAFSAHANNWHPLTWLSHELDCQIYGVHPAGHHLTSLLLHTATVIVLFLVLRAMTGALWRSAFAAAVFAIHPLRVESVAWIAERKDVLSGLFFVLTLGAYVRYARFSNSTEANIPSGGDSLTPSPPQNCGGEGRGEEVSLLPSPPPTRGEGTRGTPYFGAPLEKMSFSNSAARYGLVLLLFALGLMSKPMVMTLPAVLLLLDYWPLQRKESWGKLVLEKLPLFALSAICLFVTFLAQDKAVHLGASISPVSRLANAAVAIVTYLRQWVWPSGLAVYYPYPFGGYAAATIAIAGVVVISLTAWAILQRRRQPWLMVGWFWYGVMLLPVAGLIQVGGQAFADRYTYLPQIGVVISITWFAARWLAPRLAAILASGAVLGLMLCAAKQATYWTNSETLLTRDLACTTDNELAHDNLADVYLQKGKVDEAISQYHEALRISPNFALTHLDLARALLQKGDAPGAIGEYHAALKINPADASAKYILAWILATAPQASLRNGPEALRLAGEANDATGGKNPGILGVLAAAQAENGQYAAAVQTAQKGIDLARDAGQQDLVKRLTSECRRYQTGQPLHQ